VFKGKIKKVKADFGIGIPRCDNRLAYELEKADYRVENPSFSIKSYHLHMGVRETYAAHNKACFIPPPYKYIWPHNLFSLPKTILHNLQHPSARVSFRIDKRKINNWIPFRALRKSMSVFSDPNTNPKS
jgi:hypothetical protein